MHTTLIWRIGVDAAVRYAVTASDDKTARVWDLASGKQLAVLRVPVGANEEGRLFAVALSPDGQRVALGGWTSPEGANGNLYLFDRASGRMVQRIGGLPNVINHLAFSADGRHLAAALGGSDGIRVFAAAPPGRSWPATRTTAEVATAWILIAPAGWWPLAKTASCTSMTPSCGGSGCARRLAARISSLPASPPTAAKSPWVLLTAPR
jgi:hypothetical protein